MKLKRIIDLSNRLIYSLENSKVPFVYFILTFIFVVTLRNFLEIFSTGHLVLSRLFFIHYSLSYVALAMLLILLFYVLTKTEILKIARVILPAFAILNLAPIMDLILSWGKGYHMAYMLPGTHDGLLLRFFTFFGDFPRLGVTPGMRIEIAIVLLGSFIYFYLKNSNLIKSLFFTTLTYALIFCLGSSPFIAKRALEFIGLEYRYSDTLLTNFYLFIIFLVGVLSIFLAKRKYFKIIILDVRLLRAIHYELMFFLGVLLGIKYGVFHLTNINIFYFIFIPISIFFSGLFSLVTNNIADYEIDKVLNKERPLIKLALTLKNYKKLAWLFLGLALLYAIAVNFQTFFIILLFIGNYFLYSMPPLRLKRVPFFSKLLISLNSLILVMLGFIIITGSISGFPRPIIVIFLIAFTAVANFIDIKDYEGDRQAGVKTLPVILGSKRAKFVIGLFFILAYLSVYFLIREFHIIENLYIILYLLILGFIQFYLINKKNYDEKYIFLVYLFSLILFFYLIYLTPFNV